MANRQIAIGIDLGGTRIKGVLVDNKGRILHKRTDHTLDHNNDLENPGELWKRAVYDMVNTLKEICGETLFAIGLSAPGLPNNTNNCIAHMPGRLQGLEQFNWSKFIGIDESKIVILNDAQAALVAECAFGAGQDAKNVVMLTLGTGVGGALMVNGDLYQGNLQRAGHFGHISLHTTASPGITGTPGSLEDAIGNATLEKRSLGEYESTKDLVEAFKAGDHFSSFVWLDSVRNLSIGITSLINAFSPELVILGGGIAQAGQALFEPLEQFLNKYEWQPGDQKTPIKKARFHHFAGAVGVAIYSLQRTRTN